MSSIAYHKEQTVLASSKLKLQFYLATDIRIRHRIDPGKCGDEFLMLNTPWLLNTDSFLQLIVALDLEDNLLSCLLDISHKELPRLLNLVLSSVELSSELVIGLFLWTIDVIKTGFRKDMCRDAPQGITDGQELLNLWLVRIQEQGRCRHIFRTSFKRILNRLLGRITRASLALGPWSTRQEISDVPSGSSSIQWMGGALDMLQGFLKAVVTALVQDEGCVGFVQDVQGDLKRWDAFVSGGASGLSQLLPKHESPKRRRIEDQNRSSSNSLGKRLIMMQRSDSGLSDCAYSSSFWKKTYTHSSNTIDGRHRAFMFICNNIRQHLDKPQHPASALASSISRTANLKNDLSQSLQWVESTISGRSPGWRSCVKLKLQFYDAFSETSINEDFADLVCRCGLQWELCDVLCRYLKRHRADSLRMPLETLQRGCELLLSVFTKAENLRAMMRDHLFALSRSISGDARDPLFGSWDLWRLNIDTLLISTLNQIVSNEDPLSSSVPPRTVESLIKVVLKTIQSAVTNRGQCTILLHTLASLGQLVWLRSDPSRPTLLATVLRSLICEQDCENPQQKQQQQRQDNLAEFVLQAMNQKFAYGMVLLDQTEFLQECVVPLLEDMVSRDVAGGRFFHSVAIILIRLYETPTVTSAAGGSKPLRGVHFQILRLALQLQSLLRTWASDQASGRNLGQRVQDWDVDKIGGERMEDVSRICELAVIRLASFVNTESEIDSTESALVEDSVRSLLEAGDANDWETKLVLTPFITASRQRLGAGIELPELPYETRKLCSDHLKVFRYNKMEFSGPEETNVAKALLWSLRAGRMCDEAIQDITQALSQTSFCRSHDLETMLAPAIYRSLSISSRSECHRLLIQGVPLLVALCPGSSDVDLFWEEDSIAMSRPLGRYWKRFTRGREQVQRTLQGAASESSMDLEDVVLSVLKMSEILLRFALEPVPPKHKDSVLQVYDLGVGSDIMVDQMASLIQSSIKALRVDWSLVRLDLVLYSFLLISRMSFSVSASTGNTPGLREGTPMAKDPRVEESRIRQMAIARSKARDELVLMAMNISEEIIKRADAYLQTQGEIVAKEGSKSGMALGSDRENQGSVQVVGGKRRGQEQEHIPRSGIPTHKEDKAGNDYPSPTSPSSSALRTREGPSEETRPLPDSTLTSVSAKELSPAAAPQGISDKSASVVTNDTVRHLEEDAVESSVVLGRATSIVNDPSSLTVQRAAAQDERALSLGYKDSISGKNKAYALSSTKSLLAPDQVDCLMLGLEFLPEQEQQAVKARLRHALQS
ncbi:hypothetical protein EC968_009351 [Mortierella alpina]|nr:hypothetical protein EC968_009351 [Mortierella alpina]